MRSRSVLLIGVVLLITPVVGTTASATTLVTDGVTATRAGDRLTVAFTPAALAAAKLKRGVGVDASCTGTPPDPPLVLSSANDGADDNDRRVYGDGTVSADGTARIDLSSNVSDGSGAPLPAFDACEIDRVDPRSEGYSITTPVARVALTPAGAAWVDESTRATALHDLLVRAHGAQGYAPGLPDVVALPSPDASPPVGQAGYWTDGTRATVVSVSVAGRRLVAEDLGHGVLRSNVVEKLNLYGEAAEDLIEAILALDVSPSADRKPVTPRKDPEEDGTKSPYRSAVPQMPPDGVRASRSGGRLTVRFTGRSARAFRAIAGRRVAIGCANRPAQSPFPVLLAKDVAEGGSAVARVPRRGGRIVFTLTPPSGGLCLLVDDGRAVAIVAATDAGRRWFQDFAALNLLSGATLGHLAAPGGQAYRSTADVIEGSGKGVVAMAGPDGPVPLRRVGVWTDGARRAVIATRSGSGRTLLYADDGDRLLRTNVFGEITYFTMLLAFSVDEDDDDGRAL